MSEFLTRVANSDKKLGGAFLQLLSETEHVAKWIGATRDEPTSRWIAIRPKTYEVKFNIVKAFQSFYKRVIHQIFECLWWLKGARWKRLTLREVILGEINFE